jgi:glycosyltransferase involved in cell wall biosynthesis
MTALPVQLKRVLLVGNYPRDGQQSMLRFAEALRAGLVARGVEAEIIAPQAVLNRKGPTFHGIGKWLSYADKYLLFSWVLRWRAWRSINGSVIHICDHSNAVYTPASRTGGHPVLVTCHDLGAVRGALGEDTDCPATRTGRVLQRWIARSLGKADRIACDSSATRADVERLIRKPDGAKPETELVLLGLNAPFRALDAGEALARLGGIPGFDPAVPYVLNVGSSLKRKNRDGVLRIFARTRAAWAEGQLVFAGEALTPETMKLARELGVEDRVVQIVNPSHEVLEALYNRAFALLFPSRFEGFGWPAIEAQACGCPVLCSDAGSLAEVVAESGFVRPAADEAAFGWELVRLARDEEARLQWVRLGHENVRRFSADIMIDRYVQLYRELLA